MDLADPAQRAVFFEAHRGLPREAPGSLASTARALDLARSQAPPGPGQPCRPPVSFRRVLDVACGPGLQTLALVGLLPDAGITAVDLHRPYLAELQRRARAAGPTSRIDPVCADMARLPFPPGAFDLIWCEGGAYLQGVGSALATWRDLLVPGGRIAFTDAVWLRDDPPARVRAFWRSYPGMRNRAGMREIVAGSGFALVGDFVLPQVDWWEDYYGPLGHRLESLRRRHAGDKAGLAVLAACQAEIDLYRQHSDCYGYAFFVAARC